MQSSNSFTDCLILMFGSNFLCTCELIVCTKNEFTVVERKGAREKERKREHACVQRGMELSVVRVIKMDFFTWHH